MNMQPYRILFGAGLAVLAGAVGAQGSGDSTYPGANNSTPPSVMTRPLGQSTQTNPDNGASTARLPASRDMDATTAPGERTARPTGKMFGQSGDRIADASSGTQGQQTAKRERHASKRASRPDQVAARGETTYRQALRQCVKESDPGQRDNCLDNAIEQFQRNG